MVVGPLHHQPLRSAFRSAGSPPPSSGLLHRRFSGFPPFKSGVSPLSLSEGGCSVFGWWLLDWSRVASAMVSGVRRRASGGPRLLFWLPSFLSFSLCVLLVFAGSASPPCRKFDAAVVLLAGGTSRSFLRTNGFVAGCLFSLCFFLS